MRGYIKETVSKDVAEQTRIIYSGSVTSRNAKDLAMELDIDGFLVDVASLKLPDEFIKIVNANQ